MGASTPVLTLDRSSEQPSNLRTVEVNEDKKAAGINIIRVVAEYGPGSLDEIDAEMAKLESKMAALKARRAVIQQLYDISMTHQETTDRL